MNGGEEDFMGLLMLTRRSGAIMSVIRRKTEQVQLGFVYPML